MNAMLIALLAVSVVALGGVAYIAWKLRTSMRLIGLALRWLMDADGGEPDTGPTGGAYVPKRGEPMHKGERTYFKAPLPSGRPDDGVPEEDENSFDTPVPLPIVLGDDEIAEVQEERMRRPEVARMLDAKAIREEMRRRGG